MSCGIPDFRSKDGIYSRLAVEYPDLPDPQAMFDICYFRKNQGPFFKFAKVGAVAFILGGGRLSQNLKKLREIFLAQKLHMLKGFSATLRFP